MSVFYFLFLAREKPKLEWDGHCEGCVVVDFDELPGFNLFCCS